MDFETYKCYMNVSEFALEPNASYLEFLCLKLRSLLEKQLLESHNNSEHSTQVWKSPQQAATWRIMSMTGHESLQKNSHETFFATRIYANWVFAFPLIKMKREPTCVFFFLFQLCNVWTVLLHLFLFAFAEQIMWMVLVHLIKWVPLPLCKT